MKARYTPLQCAVLGVDEEASPHRAAMATTTSLDGMPVVICDLHSALPSVVAGIRAAAPLARVAYVMTDGGALPIWLSRTVAGLRAAGELAGTVTAGQAFGGDLEAVTLHSALLAALAVLRADVAGRRAGAGQPRRPATPWGFSGIVARRGGQRGRCARPADPSRHCDSRMPTRGERHRGISHHSRTALRPESRSPPADLVVPQPLPEPLAADVERDLGRDRNAGIAWCGWTSTVWRTSLRRCARPLLSTMGRGIGPRTGAYFLAAAAAAGRACCRRLLRLATLTRSTTNTSVSLGWTGPLPASRSPARVG